MTTQVHLQLDTELVEWVRELALREKRSLTKMCEVLLEEATDARVALAARAAPKAKVGKA